MQILAFLVFWISCFKNPLFCKFSQKTSFVYNLAVGLSFCTFAEWYCGAYAKPDYNKIAEYYKKKPCPLPHCPRTFSKCRLSDDTHWKPTKYAYCRIFRDQLFKFYTPPLSCVLHISSHRLYSNIIYIPQRV